MKAGVESWQLGVLEEEGITLLQPWPTASLTVLLHRTRLACEEKKTSDSICLLIVHTIRLIHIFMSQILKPCMDVYFFVFMAWISFYIHDCSPGAEENKA